MLTILQGDWIEQLRTLPDESVQCCVTSPPYWNLRDYGTKGQLGLEKTPQEYVEKLVIGFREVRRVLKDDGTVWLNLGDSYCSTAPGSMGDKLNQRGILSGVSNRRANASKKPRPETPDDCKPKDLVGIPWMVAFAFRADGWYLRSDIIWAKPNPMPESVTDRPTKAHEYIFLLSKKAKYFYDAEAIKEPAICEPHAAGYASGKDYAVGPMNRNGHSQREGDQTRVWGAPKPDKQRGHSRRHDGFNDRWDKMEREEQCSGMRNKRSVWTVATSPYSEAHFATFPPDLIKPCILAGSRAGNTILDPFFGSGTTGMVSLELGRKCIGIELNPEYIELAKRRCDVTPGLPLSC